MDPLRPFAILLRSLWTAAKSRPTARAQASESFGASATPTPIASEQASPAQTVTSRLQPHLTGLKEWNAGRARALFVEHALLAELGEGLTRDPAFANLVQRVSVHLGEEPALRDRLDELLRGIAAGKRLA